MNHDGGRPESHTDDMTIMNLQHLNVKILVEGELKIDFERVIEVFHAWVAEQQMPEMLIDVADYRHVPDGPGVVLVGLECDYAMDHSGDGFGLLFNRKGPLEGNNQDRIEHSLKRCAQACSMLESEFESLKFSRKQLILTVNDRALAPNTDESREQCRSIFVASLQKVLGEGDIQLEFDEEPRNRLGAKVTLENPIDLGKLAS